MRRRRFLKTALAAASITASPLLKGIPAENHLVESGDLEATIGADGIPARIQSGSGPSQRLWLASAPTLTVTNEVSSVSDSPDGDRIKALDLAFSSQWSSSRFGLVWDLSFLRSGPRTGHEVTIDLPLLSPELRIFTPSNDPEYQVSHRPTYRPVAYATMGWYSGQAYVLPLITIQDPRADQALTVALPPDVNIPHLQFEWIGGRILRLTLSHRGMGQGKPSPLRLLFYSHAADYRGALKAYSDEFPGILQSSPAARPFGRSVLVSPHPGPS